VELADLVIGLDSSTTACKAVVWDRQGRALATGRAALPMLQPRPAWHEQPAAAWEEACVQALQAVSTQVDPRRLAALCITAQRETFVVCAADGSPLMNGLLWMDERSRQLLPEIDRLYGKERFHQESGKPLSANLSLGKLFWLRAHRPELFARIHYVLDVHAFLAHLLTGRYVTSWGCADPMGLFDMRKHAWNQSLIEAIGLRVDQFPEAIPPGAQIGTITPQAAQRCGLPEGLLVVAGLGDGQAAGLGVQMVQPGDVYLNLGTAVVSGTYSQRYLVDPAFRTSYAGQPDAYFLETVLLGGTYTINWFIEKFYDASKFGDTPGQRPEETLEKAAAQIPPGAQGLTLVPYWNSAMNPYWDAAASGIVVGWRGIHGPAHLYRAILEGIALEQRLHTSGVEAALNQPAARFIAVGGGARSSLWCQLIADVCGKPVYRADAPEASALGAGILAAVGARIFKDTQAAAQHMTRIDQQSFTPDPARHAFYSKLYEEVYQGLYPALRRSLGRLADLSEETGETLPPPAGSQPI
jgi:xylulokinase